MGNTIYKNIKEYKKGNKEIFREIINVFNPLINKLSKSVNGEDTRQDLLVHLLEIINKLPEENRFEDDKIIFAIYFKTKSNSRRKLSKNNSTTKWSSSNYKKWFRRHKKADIKKLISAFYYVKYTFFNLLIALFLAWFIACLDTPI